MNSILIIKFLDISFKLTLMQKLSKGMSIEEIIQHKLIYHIDYIPQNEKNTEKLKEILISILVNKSIEIGNKFIPIHGQVGRAGRFPSPSFIDGAPLCRIIVSRNDHRLRSVGIVHAQNRGTAIPGGTKRLILNINFDDVGCFVNGDLLCRGNVGA